MSAKTLKNIGDYVTYVGDNRQYLHDKLGVVERISDSGTLGVRILDNNELAWGAEWAWDTAEQEPEAGSFLEPHAKSIAAIDAEIARLTARISELKTARQVLSSL